ncbi:MAG: lipopolysaccharide biosynthesis protein [Candidatus Krumholzibacteriia bacterium]
MTDQFKARVVRGVGWSAVRTWSTRLVTFVVFPILARILGPEAYGLVALAGVFLTVLDIFSDVSFGAAIEQRQDLEPEHLDAVFWAFAALGVFMTGTSIAAAPLVAKFFDEPDLVPVIRWLSFAFLLQMVSGVQTSLLRRDLRMGVLAATALAANVIGAAVGITMALTGRGVWSIVAQRLVLQFLTVALVWWQSHWRPRWRFSLTHLRDVSRFGLSVMGNRVLNYLNKQFDQLLIGRVLGKVDLGYYYTATRLYTLLNNLLIGAISQVAMPAMARLQGDPERFRRSYVKACRYLCLVSLPIFVGLSIVSQDFILVLTGPEWLPSAPALQLLALVGVVHVIQYVNGAAIMALGRADLRLLTQAVHSVVNVIGFLMVVRHGFVAVAAAYTIRAWLLLPLDLAVSRWLGAVSVRALAAAIWPQLIATAAMAGGLLVLRSQVLDTTGVMVRLLATAGAGAVIYGGVISALDRHIWAEMKDLAQAARLGQTAPVEDQS